MVTVVSDDLRWRRFLTHGFACPNCREVHKGIFDLACAKPDPWTGDETKAPNGAITGAKHILTEDFCILENEHFFVRCVLQLPIQGTHETFRYGVWSTLSRENFEIYLDHFDSGDYRGHGPWFGWFSNGLKGYPQTLNLKCDVHPCNGRLRPLVELRSADHPLVREQEEGITFDRLLEIYALHGHDIRTSLGG
jgi:hypothetical protein